MNRRAFVTGLGAILAAPLVAEAQPRRIGFLSSNSASLAQHLVNAFRQGLLELGYVDGQNIRIEYRFADGKFEPLPALAAELVGLNVDVIVAGASNAVFAARVLPQQSPS